MSEYGEYLEFKDSGNAGFRSASCDGFGLAVYGAGAFENTMCHSSALSVTQGSASHGLGVDGNALINGNLIIQSTGNTSSGNIEAPSGIIDNITSEKITVSNLSVETLTCSSGSINNIKSVIVVQNIHTSYPPTTTKYEYLQVHNNTSNNYAFTYNSSGSKVTLAPYATILFKNMGTA
jgi:hypothetical protein